MTQDRITIEGVESAAPAGDAAQPFADAARLAAILDSAFSAENHESLDAEITRLMLDLSKEADFRHLVQEMPTEERLRMLVKAVLMALRRA